MERIQEEIGAKASFVCSININQSIIQNAHNVLQTAIDFACEKKEEDEKPNGKTFKKLMRYTICKGISLQL